MEFTTLDSGGELKAPTMIKLTEGVCIAATAGAEITNLLKARVPQQCALATTTLF
jgi:hypothetical protein